MKAVTIQFIMIKRVLILIILYLSQFSILLYFFQVIRFLTLDFHFLIIFSFSLVPIAIFLILGLLTPFNTVLQIIVYSLLS